MLIKRITLKNFMSHHDTVLELPDKGVILVTGANGSGKSSLAEAIAVAGWGKTLRGSPGWVTGSHSQVRIDAAVGNTSLQITRESSAKGKIKLTFEPSDTSYATVSKAQTVLESYVGDFDTWRRCAVFSSQDASHFTLSTDSERKRLLEALLGLDRFDVALEKCRKDKKKVQAICSDLERVKLKLETQLVANEKLEKETSASLSNLGSLEALYTQHDLAAIQSKLQANQEATRNTENDGHAIRDERSDLLAQEQAARRRIKAVSVDRCPTCSQFISQEWKLTIRTSETDRLEKTTGRLKESEESYKEIQEKVRGLKNEAQGLGERIYEVDQNVSAFDKQDTLRQHLIHQRTKTVNEAAALKDSLQKTKRDLDDRRFDLSILENIETVLGTKGVRAHILSSALGALEITSNKWLQKISNGEFRLRIRPYTEKKTGGQREAIALHVDGIAGGNGYKGASGGQRRRIDVALLLGLAELAQASNQFSGGTLFFDEVFDSLDADGVESVSRVIQSLGSRMPVVIVSHSSALVENIEADLQIRIADGAIV